MVAVHLGHRAVGHHQIEIARAKFGQPLAAVDRGLDLVPVASEEFGFDVANDWFVVDDQHPQGTHGSFGWLRGRGDPLVRTDGQANGERRSLARLALNVDRGAVPLDDAVDDGQTQARAVFAFGGEKRLQAALPHFFVHADAVIPDLQHKMRGLPIRIGRAGQADRASTKSDHSPFGQGIDRVEHDVG